MSNVDKLDEYEGVKSLDTIVMLEDDENGLFSEGEELTVLYINVVTGGVFGSRVDVVVTANPITDDLEIDAEDGFVVPFGSFEVTIQLDDDGFLTQHRFSFADVRLSEPIRARRPTADELSLLKRMKEIEQEWAELHGGQVDPGV